MRVTGTEGIIAYRTADYERWQQLDFVEGIEINTSHTNHPVADICDELKGVYPKEFKWTGWHPMCRCNATAKMSDFDAFLTKQQEYIDNGTQLDYSENKVTEMPKNSFVKLGDNFEIAWINPRTNKPPKPMEYRKSSFEQMVSALEKQCSAVGRYHIGINWEYDLHGKKIESGHVLTAERLQNGKFRYFDPQIGEFINIEEYAKRNIQYLESIKVDKLLININIFRKLCEVR